MQRRNYTAQSGTELAAQLRKKALATPDLPVSGGSPAPLPKPPALGMARRSKLAAR